MPETLLAYPQKHGEPLLVPYKLPSAHPFVVEILEEIEEVSLQQDLGDFASVVEKHYAYNPQNLSDKQLERLFTYGVIPVLSLFVVTAEVKRLMPSTVRWGYLHLKDPSTYSQWLFSVDHFVWEDLKLISKNPTIIQNFVPLTWQSEKNRETVINLSSPLTSLYDLGYITIPTIYRLIGAIADTKWFNDLEDRWDLFPSSSHGIVIKAYQLFLKKGSPIEEIPERWLPTISTMRRL